jgi:glycosyltransferase involved in cell wall biosynthesis
LKRLNLLFLTARFPFPLIGGDRIKSYHLLAGLAKHHDVSLISFFQGEWKDDYKQAILDLGVKEVRFIHINPIVNGFKAFLGSLGEVPLEILYYKDERFKNEVDSIFKSNKFDIAISFFLRTNIYLFDKQVKKIFIAEDSRTLYQYRSYSNSLEFYQRFIRKWEFKKLQKFELDAMKYFDLITFVSKDEIENVHRLYIDRLNYSVLTNGTAFVDYFDPEKVKFEERSYILFTGNFGLYANVLMLREIANKIFPKILEKFPDIRLKIVGANASAEIEGIAKHPNIDLVGKVENIIDFYLKARLFILPHRGGSGIQNKILEAMGTGCPVISTPTGNHGVHGINGEDLLLATTTEEFIEKSIELLSDNNLSKKIGLNAHYLIKREHSWSVVHQKMDEIIEEVYSQEKVLSAVNN